MKYFSLDDVLVASGQRVQINWLFGGQLSESK